MKDIRTLDKVLVQRANDSSVALQVKKKLDYQETATTREIKTMTLNGWQNEILNTCKYCKYFTDKRRGRYRYQCDKYFHSIYEAHGCKKTLSVRQQASEMSRKTLDEVFFELTEGHMEQFNVLP